MIKTILPLMPHTIDEIIDIIGPRATKHIHPVGGRVSIRMSFTDLSIPTWQNFYYMDWTFEIYESGACAFLRPISNNYREAICVKPATQTLEAAQ